MTLNDIYTINVTGCVSKNQAYLQATHWLKGDWKVKNSAELEIDFKAQLEKVSELMRRGATETARQQAYNLIYMAREFHDTIENEVNKCAKPEPIEQPRIIAKVGALRIVEIDGTRYLSIEGEKVKYRLEPET